MKIFPPHLPPRACRVPFRRAYQSVPLILAFFLIAILSAFTTTMGAIAWFMPFQYMSQLGITVVRAPGEGTEVKLLDELVQQQVKKRIVHIYDTREKLGGAYYATGAKKGTAMILSAEGWATMLLPTYTWGEEYFWEVVDYQGRVYKVSSLVRDSATDIVYFRMNGDRFRGDVSFPDWDMLDVKDVLWSPNNLERSMMLGDIDILSNEKSFLLTKEHAAYTVSTLDGDELPVYDPLILKNGAFVGFLRKDGTVLPSWYVSAQLVSLFETGTVGYSGIPVKGTVVDHSVNGEHVYEVVSGFFVSFLPYQLYGGGLLLHDVIIEVEGQPFHIYETQRDILLDEHDTVHMRVLRGGEMIDVDVKKVRL